MTVAAVASMMSAATTALLINLPSLYDAPSDFSARVALTYNGWYQLRSWTYYLHPFVCFLAGIGVWRVSRSYDRGLALLAIIGLGVWAYTEALQQALTIVAAGWNWFPDYATANADGRASIQERWAMFSGLWDGLYFLLLTGFLLANLTFGVVLVRARGSDRIVGACLLFLALLSFLSFFAGYGGPGWVAAVTGTIYPYFQPALRFGVGVWLWRRRHTK